LTAGYVVGRVNHFRAAVQLAFATLGSQRRRRFTSSVFQGETRVWMMPCDGRRACESRHDVRE
jgi:hypothetical protein